MGDETKNLLSGLDSTPVLLSEARRGNIQAAQQALEQAGILIMNGKTLPGELAQWIAEGLLGIASGDDARSLFHLKKPRGKRTKLSEELEHFVAVSIHHSSAGRHKGINADGVGQGAYAEAAEFFNISENTAEKLYKKYIDRIIHEEKLVRELRAENE